ncbi:MAG: hypothetical protein ACPGD5_07845 [Salibacteraceae bacterium]
MKLKKFKIILLITIGIASRIQAQDVYFGIELIPRTFEFQSLNIENFETRIEQNREISFSIPMEYKTKNFWSFGLSYSFVKYKYNLTITTPIDKNNFILHRYNEKSSNIRVQIGKTFNTKKLKASFTPFVGLNSAYNHSRFIPTGWTPTDAYIGGSSFLYEPNDTVLIWRSYSSPTSFFYHLTTGINLKYDVTDRVALSGTVIANQGVFKISYLTYEIWAQSQTDFIYGQLFSRGSNINLQIGLSYKITEHNNGYSALGI